jgi:hypothetical protein
MAPRCNLVLRKWRDPWYIHDRENLNAQLLSGVRALQAPVDNLQSNWAYVVMMALAWNLKAWWALWAMPPLQRWLARNTISVGELC